MIVIAAIAGVLLVALIILAIIGGNKDFYPDLEKDT
jgi:hypothetical protein